ncbi:2-iminoacetate synthase ThiH [Cetobacterium sp.]|uniref:2-iminoacetate synthase ThiH n=2 Tax=Cetobacterium sp. TaxID=2071632 RepID=UPI002FC8001B
MKMDRIVESYNDFDFENFFRSLDSKKILDVIDRSGEKVLEDMDLLTLLSPQAQEFLEEMATKANVITKQYFGKEIHIYAPLYISNICDNECTYCGFKHSNPIKRRHLTYDEIEKESKYISETLGVHSIILLTGESYINSLEYLKNAIIILKKYFNTVIIEVQPLSVEEYSELKTVGLDGVTVYQECYDKELYKTYHLSGKKSDYKYRLDTPERASIADLRSVNIGALFGLGNPVQEAFLSGLHLRYLTNKFLNTQFSISIPRIKEAYRNIKPQNIISDKQFVQFLLAYRLCFPTSGINISTRESKEFRDNLLPLGVTKFSAGSVTEVGGYSLSNGSSPQFETDDHRSVVEIVDMLKIKGYQPIFKDWESSI